MASQMMVMPSRDTLFIRGFTSRRDIQDIREFFERQAGSETTIEFFKQSEQDDSLFVALKFESREIAKDILNRFDDTEVLGDRIEMTWFKDLRKAKQQAMERAQRYGRMDYSYHNRYNRRRSPMNRGRYNRDRSYSRSVSRSRSRSRSGSRGRSKRRRQSSSRSGSSSSERPAKSSKNRSHKSKHNDDDHKKSNASPKKATQEDGKAANSPEYSPSRPEVTPSPKVRGDAMKRPVDDGDAVADSLLKQRAVLDDDAAALQRLQLERQLEQQRLKRRQEHEELARLGGAGKSLRHSEQLLDMQELIERRRALRAALSPELDTSDDRLRKTTLESSMFWDELDDPRKAKALTKDPVRSLSGLRHLDDDDALRMRMLDDDDKWPLGSDVLQRRARQARDLEFSQDAMGLVQEKKKEIERIYKNDCETFVTVVKMLISKDPSLEEKLQYTLRENLKEIGQRCILDLREYMDRLRDHDSPAAAALKPLSKV